MLDYRLVFRDAGFTETVNEARKKAKSVGKSILTSVSTSVDEIDPLKVFFSMRKLDDAVLWSHENQSLSIVGAGNVVSISADGPDPFDKIRAQYRGSIKDAVIKRPSIKGVGPIFFGGFRYDPESKRDEMWEHFPDASFVLPRIVFSSINREQWLTINLLVSEDSDANLETDKILSELEKLEFNDIAEEYVVDARACKADQESHWVDTVNYALQAIEKKYINKVVLARKKTFMAEKSFSPEIIIKQLSSEYPECTVFAIHRGSTTFLGATPEELAVLENDVITTKCLAGTTGRGKSMLEDEELRLQLMSDAKELNEHSSVSNMIRDALKNVCNDVRGGHNPDVMRLKNVQHLQTLFTGNIKPGCDLIDVVRVLHPTPAVAGDPTENAKKMIRDIEGDRGWYSAPVGWIDDNGDGEFIVAIRSALINGIRATLFAGAGIVKGSLPDREFQETELKFQPLLAAIDGVGN